VISIGSSSTGLGTTALGASSSTAAGFGIAWESNGATTRIAVVNMVEMRIWTLKMAGKCFVLALELVLELMFGEVVSWEARLLL
jgi:hypothetical protein